MNADDSKRRTPLDFTAKRGSFTTLKLKLKKLFTISLFVLEKNYSSFFHTR